MTKRRGEEQRSWQKDKEQGRRIEIRAEGQKGGEKNKEKS